MSSPRSQTSALLEARMGCSGKAYAACGNALHARAQSATHRWLTTGMPCETASRCFVVDASQHTRCVQYELRTQTAWVMSRRVTPYGRARAHTHTHTHIHTHTHTHTITHLLLEHSHCTRARHFDCQNELLACRQRRIGCAGVQRISATTSPLTVMRMLCHISRPTSTRTQIYQPRTASWHKYRSVPTTALATAGSPWAREHAYWDRRAYENRRSEHAPAVLSGSMAPRFLCHGTRVATLGSPSSAGAT